MTKKLRKPLSIILSLMMILSLFTIIPMTANAQHLICPYCGSEDIEYEDGIGEWFCYECGWGFGAPIDTDANYTITWKNWDGTTLATDSVKYGNMPSYQGAEITRNEDDYFTYEFSRWHPAISSAKGDATYYAQLKRNAKQGVPEEQSVTIATNQRKSVYEQGDIKISVQSVGDNSGFLVNDYSDSSTVSVKGNGTITKMVMTRGYSSGNYNASPIIIANGKTTMSTQSGEVFTCDNIVANNVGIRAYGNRYTFIKEVTVYYIPPTIHTVTWKNWDGSVLETDEDVAEGATPEYNGNEPTKPEDDENTYEFAGWTPEITAVSANAEYTATFTAVPKQTTPTTTETTVVWDSSTGSFDQTVVQVTGEGIVDFGYELAIAYETESGTFTTSLEGAKFTKIEISGGYISGFSGEGWSGRTWTGEAASVPFSGWLADGSHDNPFTITFTLSVPAATEPTYTVTWNNYDGTELEKDEGVENDSLPKYDGATPAKAEDSVNTYEFAGWNDGENTYALNEALPQVTDDVTYTAVFTSVPKSYYVIGTMTNWAVDDAYKLTKNEGTDVAEYSLSGLDLTTDSQFKVVYAANSEIKKWFPDPGDNYGANGEITDDAKYTVYFRPDYNGGDDWFCNAIYVAMDVPEESQAVISMIEALPAAQNVTTADAQAIAAARAAYDALTPLQQTFIDDNTLAKLTAAETALAAAQDKAAADDVTAMINNLPAEVTANDAQAITAAREAYNNLTNDQKALIDADTLAKLETAEAALEAATRTYDKVNANDADCTASGNIEYYLGSDGKFYSDDQGTPLDDLNNDGVVDINDTIIPATPHEYVETIVQPKNGKPGYLLHTCSNCNDSYKDNYFNDPLKNTSRIETEGKVGEAVNLYGAAEGGVPGYTYAFLYRKSTTETWTKIGKKYGTATSAKFTPGKATKYIIMINVKDSIGKIKSKTFTLDLSNPLVNNTTVNAETVKVGERIVLKGAASGGIVGGTTGYKYAFYYKKSKNTEWLPMVDEYTTKSAAFKPKKATSYDVMSVVKDSEGKTDIKSFTVNVTAAE